jgi:hypothetical protein
MIIGTLNIRGLGSRVKKKKVREFVVEEKLDFLALQESKVEVFVEPMIHYLWGSDDCDWVFLRYPFYLEKISFFCGFLFFWLWFRWSLP